MNITEANDTQTVLRYLTGAAGPAGIPNADQAQDAAERLADRAHRTLGAGLTGDDIRSQKHQLKAWG